MIKLYYSPGSCSLVAHIALRLAGAEFELKRVNLQAGEQNTPEYRAINPHGRVPVLDLGEGRRLTESTVIATYLAETYPQAGLLPTEPFQVHRGRELMTFANATMHSTSFAAIFRPARFTPDEALHKHISDEGKKRLANDLAFINERLGGRDWGAPDQITVTDLFLYVYGRWAGRVGVSMDALPAYDAHIARVNAVAAVQDALAAEGLK